MFQPAGAGALVRAAAPSLESSCSTIAAAAIADEQRDRGEDDQSLPEDGRHGVSVADGAATRVVLVDEPDAELAKLLVGHRGRRAGQRIGSARHLRERDHLADVRLAGHERDEALDPHREAAVRRRAHRQRLEEEGELPARLLVAHPHRPEDVLLDVRAVDPDRARAELPAVPDQVVVLAERVAAGSPATRSS